MAKQNKNNRGNCIKIWTDTEVEALIRVWGEPGIQRDLEAGNNFSKKRVWKKIVGDLNKVEKIVCNAKQVKNKINRLRSEYERAAVQTTGGDKRFPYWHLLYPILANRRRCTTISSPNVRPRDNAVAVGDQQRSSSTSTRNDHAGESSGITLVYNSGEMESKHPRDETAAVITKHNQSLIRYKDRKQQRDCTETDKLIESMKEMEERANERDDKRDQVLAQQLASLEQTQQAFIGFLKHTIRQPVSAISPSNSAFTMFPSSSYNFKNSADGICVSSAKMTKELKFIIDTDVGTDDACALILALSHPKVDVLALTTVFGNVPLEQAVANCSRIRRLVQREDIPIFAGASGPLMPLLRSDKSDDIQHYHGEDGLGDSPEIYPPAVESDFNAAVEGKHAAMAIIDIIRANPGCTMLCLGPLTNLALALKLDRSIGDNLKHLYLMGGNVQAIGNVRGSYTAEFNFYRDPEAAHIVLSELGCPITAVPWEVYLNHPCSTEFTTAYMQNVATTKGRFIQGIMRKPFSCSLLTYGLCDELATAIAIDPSIALESETRYYATVELQGLYTRGQVALDHRNCSGKTPNVEFVTKVDLRTTERMLLESLEDEAMETMSGIANGF